jgi:hypothetical protein
LVSRAGTGFAFLEGTGFPAEVAVKDLRARQQPAWIVDIAEARSRPLVMPDHSVGVPQSGDVVLKPFIDHRTFKQLFRVETWETHDLLDGPFEHVRDALDAALEFGVTARLAVWLDYSDEPDSHHLDSVPLYLSDTTAAERRTVA